jgi:hypothetical protein
MLIATYRVYYLAVAGETRHERRADEDAHSSGSKTKIVTFKRG